MLGEGWIGYEKLVLSKLEELQSDVKELTDEIGKLKVEIAMLKVKSGLWGAAAGLVPFGLFIAYTILGNQ